MNTIEQNLFLKLKETNNILCTAESCTGGLIGGRITDLSGSSSVFDCGFITYSNEAKMKLIGVKEETLINHGAVSQQTAFEMAVGALEQSAMASISIAVTGIAGPNGGSADKPVGLVWFGMAFGNRVHVEKQIFEGDREYVRTKTVDHALSLVLDALNHQS